ncbi:hypothetical protein GOP47_0018781 [Adiantum capillus-veneris]|uniref:Uncharacterized protein n=1 Tax=Adiantum capillus-veneris TaxID=13818 RepID=A0A9D4Z9Y3_ADICA|nr:hypothetical protein GOP47_0018781 [Adiantum capillus-veneris]
MALGKAIAAPLLILTLLMYLIILGIAGWAFNRILDTGNLTGANSATYPFVLLSLIAGVVGIASALTGLHHLKAWRGESGASAGASALIAWLLTALAFGLACKEIHTSKFRGAKIKTLEAFIIMVTFFQLLYLAILHAGLHSSKYGPGYYNYGARGYGDHELGDKHRTTAAPAV